MIDVLVYGISLKSGGGLSVLKDFYFEAIENASKYPNVRWHFALSTQDLKEADNVVVWKEPSATKTWVHRLYHNYVSFRRYTKRNNIKAVVSLQSMQVKGCRIPSMICLHNVLPLYKCDSSVLESFKQRMKQALINRSIVNSIKKARMTFVPSKWIKDAFVLNKGIPADRITVSSMRIPDVPDRYVRCSSENYLTDSGVVFFYPAACFPYKNHAVIVKACEILEKDGIENYSVRFTFMPGQNRTAAVLADEIRNKGLKITMDGPMTRDEVMDSYRQKVLLFPSRIENDAMPIIECMQCKGAVIAAKLPYATNLLEEYQNGFLFAPNDEEELARIMRQIIREGVDLHESRKPKSETEECRVRDVIYEIERIIT